MLLLQGSANPQAGVPVGTSAPLLASSERHPDGRQGRPFNPPQAALGGSAQVGWGPAAIPAPRPRQAAGPVTSGVRTFPGQPADSMNFVSLLH